MGVCSTCRFWKPSDYTRGEGDCRAHPPSVIVNNEHVGQLWPTTKTDDWCGEWEDKSKDIGEQLEAAKRRVGMED